MDKIRTETLGYSDVNIRTHLRRRGGASDLFDAGVSIRDIKLVGHWSFGVLDSYLSWTPAQIAQIQLKGILKAEHRIDNNYPSRILVLNLYF